MRCKNILGLRAWIHLPHLCFLHYLLLSPVSFLSLPDFFVFVFNTKKNLHGTEFPRSNPHLNSIIPIKKLRNGPHSALPADIFFSPSHCFLHCLVTEGIFGNGVNACLSQAVLFLNPRQAQHSDPALYTLKVLEIYLSSHHISLKFSRLQALNYRPQNKWETKEWSCDWPGRNCRLLLTVLCVLILDKHMIECCTCEFYLSGVVMVGKRLVISMLDHIAL